MVHGDRCHEFAANMWSSTPLIDAPESMLLLAVACSTLLGNIAEPLSSRLRCEMSLMTRSPANMNMIYNAQQRELQTWADRRRTVPKSACSAARGSSSAQLPASPHSSCAALTCPYANAALPSAMSRCACCDPLGQGLCHYDAEKTK